MIVTLRASEDRTPFNTAIEHMVPASFQIQSGRPCHSLIMGATSSSGQANCCMLRRDPIPFSPVGKSPRGWSALSTRRSTSNEEGLVRGDQKRNWFKLVTTLLPAVTFLLAKLIDISRLKGRAKLLYRGVRVLLVFLTSKNKLMHTLRIFIRLTIPFEDRCLICR
jgi:hypothetical protein